MVTSFFYFLLVMDDEKDERFLLYSQVALLADFNSAFSGLTFVKFRLAYFKNRFQSVESHACSK